MSLSINAIVTPSCDSVDATLAGPDGQPDPAQSYSATQGGLPGDIDSLNGTAWDFVRFRVDFEQSATGLTGPAPALDFVAIPFRF